MGTEPLRRLCGNVPCMSGNRSRSLNAIAETDDSILLDRPADILSYQQQGPKPCVQVDRDFSTGTGTKYAIPPGWPCPLMLLQLEDAISSKLHGTALQAARGRLHLMTPVLHVIG
jgi:hypothetical protein